jgi:signal transduction histidine kinase
MKDFLALCLDFVLILLEKMFSSKEASSSQDSKSQRNQRFLAASCIILAPGMLGLIIIMLLAFFLQQKYQTIFLVLAMLPLVGLGCIFIAFKDSANAGLVERGAWILVVYLQITLSVDYFAFGPSQPIAASWLIDIFIAKSLLPLNITVYLTLVDLGSTTLIYVITTANIYKPPLQLGTTTATFFSLTFWVFALFTAILMQAFAMIQINRDNRLILTQRETAISRSAELERALKDRNKAYKIIGQKDRDLVIEAQRERVKNANNIHDGPVQTLSLMVNKLQSLRIAGEAHLLSNDDLLELIISSLDGANQELREVIATWYVTQVRDGLSIALEELKRKFEKQQFGLEITLDIRLLGEGGLAADDKRYPGAIEEAIFGVAQEALQNVIKHAQAKHVWVSLIEQNVNEEEAEEEETKSYLSLKIQDDGIGFFKTNDQKSYGQAEVDRLLAQRQRENHVGINGRRKQIEYLRGDFIIESSNNGTLIKVRVPL